MSGEAQRYWYNISETLDETEKSDYARILRQTLGVKIDTTTDLNIKSFVLSTIWHDTMRHAKSCGHRSIYDYLATVALEDRWMVVVAFVTKYGGADISGVPLRLTRQSKKVSFKRTSMSSKLLRNVGEGRYLLAHPRVADVILSFVTSSEEALQASLDESTDDVERLILAWTMGMSSGINNIII